MAAYGIPQISTGDILRANIAQGHRPRQAGQSPRRSGHSSSPTTWSTRWSPTVSPSPTPAAATSSTAFPAPSTRPTGSTRTLAADARPLFPSSPSASSSTTSIFSTASPAAASRPQAASTTSTRIPPQFPASVTWTAPALVQRPDDSEAVFVERMKTFERPDRSRHRALPQAGPLRRDQRRPTRRTGHRRNRSRPQAPPRTLAQPTSTRV